MNVLVVEHVRVLHDSDTHTCIVRVLIVSWHSATAKFVLADVSETKQYVYMHKSGMSNTHPPGAKGDKRRLL